MVIRTGTFYAPWPVLDGKPLSNQWGEIRSNQAESKAIIRNTVQELGDGDELNALRALLGQEYGDLTFRNKFRFFYDKASDEICCQKNDGTVVSPIWVDAWCVRAHDGQFQVTSEGGITSSAGFYGPGLQSIIEVAESSSSADVSIKNPTRIFFNSDDGFGVEAIADGANIGQPEIRFTQPFGKAESFTKSGKVWEVNHEFGIVPVLVQVMDTDLRVVIPDKADLSDPDTAYFYFNEVFNGSVYIASGGLGSAALVPRDPFYLVVRTNEQSSDGRLMRKNAGLVYDKRYFYVNVDLDSDAGGADKTAYISLTDLATNPGITIKTDEVADPDPAYTNATTLNFNSVEFYLSGDLQGNPVVNLNAVLATGSTTARPSDQRFGEVFNVKDYGALGNGIVDDTSAVQAAIDAANTAGGGIVHLPRGTYEFVTAIVPKSNVWIRGDGVGATKLNQASTASAVHVIDAGTTSNTNISISDLEISMADTTGSNGHAIRFSDGSSDIRLFNLHIHDTRDYGIGFQNNTGAAGFKRIWIDSIYIKNSGADGIDIKDNAPDDSEQIFISNVVVESPGQVTASQAGIDIRGIANLTNIQVIGLDTNQPDTGIRFRSPAKPGVLGTSGRFSTLVGFFVKGTGSSVRGINVSGAHTVVSNGVIDLSGGTSRGVLVSSSTETTITSIDTGTNVVTSTGHGYTVDNHGPVMVQTTVTIPAGLTVQTEYWIDFIDADTYKFLDAPDGSEIDITTTGSGTHTVTEVSHDNSIHNVKVLNANQGAQLNVEAIRTVFSDCEFYKCGIGISENSTDALIKDCMFDNLAATGVLHGAISLNGTVQGCTFRDGSARGIQTTSGGSGTRAIDNIFDNNATGSINNNGSTNIIYKGNVGVTAPVFTAAATMLVPPNAGIVKINGTTTIDQITATYDGDEITLVGNDGNSRTIDDTNNLKLAAAFSLGQNDTITLICDGSDWFEKSNSTN